MGNYFIHKMFFYLLSLASSKTLKIPNCCGLNKNFVVWFCVSLSHWCVHIASNNSFTHIIKLKKFATHHFYSHVFFATVPNTYTYFWHQTPVDVRKFAYFEKVPVKYLFFVHVHSITERFKSSDFILWEFVLGMYIVHVYRWCIWS